MQTLSRIKLTSQQIMATLKISACHLMHMREAGSLKYEKAGNAYLYTLPPNTSILDHPLGKQLIDWHTEKHQFNGSNLPQSLKSKSGLEDLLVNVLFPIEKKFKKIKITYGFTSLELKKYIQKLSPKGTAPHLDQHCAFEVDHKDELICQRGGAACDLIVDGKDMRQVVKFIVKELNFDRLYFYGDNRPIHVSVNVDLKRHLQIMHENSAGIRYPGKKAFGEKSSKLANEL